MLRRGTTKYTASDQMQIFSLIKSIEASEVTLITQPVHSVMAWISFYLRFLSQRTLAELNNSQ